MTKRRRNTVERKETEMKKKGRERRWKAKRGVSVKRKNREKKQKTNERCGRGKKKNTVKNNGWVS